MHRLIWAVAIVAAGVAPAASAQTPEAAGIKAPGTAAVTLLHLSAEGAVSLTPGELVADLTAEATSASVVEAQRKVNAMMAQGLKDAHAVGGVDARAAGYSVSQTELDTAATSHPRRTGWTARQTLELRGADGDPVLALVGKLQDEGLAVDALDWQLSREQARDGRDAAMVQALQALRLRAGKAATALGLTVDRLQDVRVDAPEPRPIRPMMAAQMRASVPPQATPAPQDITSEVSADIALRP